LSSIVWDEIPLGSCQFVIKINVCLRADPNPFLAALYGRHPVRLAVRPTVDFRPTEASKAAIRYDRFTSNLGGQLVCVAGIDRYAIAVRVGQLEILVTKEFVLSNCVYRQSLFH
jgi:hypothetical protein